jgi:hypothetical protein
MQLGLAALNIATIGGLKTVEQARGLAAGVRIGEEALGFITGTSAANISAGLR